MIVTRSWLNEWINLDGITTDELCKTFNAIGLEVDRVESFKVPGRVVVGEVIECEKHPDADKLNICKVDVGTGIRQIVCGASNVRVGIKVPVATIGAVMSESLTIKPVKLRGIDSEGMICSSTEIGQVKLNDGIMILDETVTSLELGYELSKCKILNDDLIEIELTANRGDCLSIRGVCRDISAAFNRTLNEVDLGEEDRSLGIGRVLQLNTIDDADINLQYRAFELNEVQLPLVMQLRLKQIEDERSCAIDSILHYATVATGVVLRGYNSTFFGNKSKVEIDLKKDENGYACVCSGDSKASTIGIKQEDDSRIKDTASLCFLEASYIAPDLISKQMFENKIESGPLYYRTSRGSEPYLELGVAYCIKLLEKYCDVKMYSGNIEHRDSYVEPIVSISLEDVNSIIGMNIEKTTINQILQNLGFNIGKSSADRFVISIPRYRHDIVNRQDIVEEIVRMVGIDNITSKPFIFAEENRFNDDYTTYKKRREYRHRAAFSGFDESIHFVFNERAKLEKYGFECIDKEKEILNPIVNTMDTLRPTILLNLLDSASLNAKSGKKQIKLFEIGSVFNENREESTKASFIFSGESELDNTTNAGKPKSIDFASFSQAIATVIGDVEFLENSSSHKLAHPFQNAKVIQDGKVIGEMFRVHPTVCDELGLDITYLCELEFSELKYESVEAEEYSKFQTSFRDLSIVLPSTINYKSVADVIESSRSKELVRFYPVDKYEDETLGDSSSLTLRFVLQSREKTLEEDDITSSMSGVLDALKNELGLNLR
ncbi:MAG: phenylalanine--tRNA ligase subunit beta [Helicobacteraceae bacterium]|nr:phenylalanine--tRNA ligase subunit beta [Helicobacteraceae bacterium]